MTTKKVIIALGIFAGFSVAALAAHIISVSKPKIDSSSIAMARIDINSDINNIDAHNITRWLYAQPGIEHVLCNPETNIVVFTFYPAVAKADDISKAFSLESGYAGKRYMPTNEELKTGCPINASGSNSIATIYKNIFH